MKATNGSHTGGKRPFHSAPSLAPRRGEVVTFGVFPPACQRGGVFSKPRGPTPRSRRPPLLLIPHACAPWRLSRDSRPNPVRLVTFDRIVLDEVVIGTVGTHDGQPQNTVLLLKVTALQEHDFATVW